MSEMFSIKPACAGATILDPMTMENLPEGGAWKPRNAYWVGLEIRGDVVACKLAKPGADELEQVLADEPAPPSKPSKTAASAA